MPPSHSFGAGTRYLQLGLVTIILDQEASQDVAPGGQIVDLLLCQSTFLQQTCQPRLFLCRVLRVGTKLRQCSQIVVDGFVFQTLRGSLDLTGRFFDIRDPASCNVVRKNSINCIDGTGFGVKPTTNDTVGAGFGVDKVDDCLFTAGT